MEDKTRDPKIIKTIVRTLILRHNLKMTLTRRCIMRAVLRDTGYMLRPSQVENILNRSSLIQNLGKNELQLNLENNVKTNIFAKLTEALKNGTRPVGVTWNEGNATNNAQVQKENIKTDSHWNKESETPAYCWECFK